MASQQPPHRPSWKDKAAGGTPSGAPTGPSRAWKDNPGTAQSPVPPGTRKRRTKLFIGIGTLVLLIILFVVVLLWLIPPKGATLVLVGSGYEDNLVLPHNLQGWQTMNDLDQLTESGGRGGLHRGMGPTTAPRDPRRWIEGWNDLKADPVILYLALHGGCDESGPFLFLDDPTGQTRLPMKDVFDHLENGSLKDSRKILILDATQTPSDWRTGQLNNEFAVQVQAMAEQRKVDKLHVLMASGQGQRSWVSEDWQQTIFGHYVVEGLRGGADKEPDNRVTLLELVEFVEQNVPAWVQANRDAVQVPVFIGDRNVAKKLELGSYSGKYAAPTPPTRTLPKKELLALWDGVDEMNKQVPPPYAYAPDLWRQYLDLTMRVEQVIRAGDPTGKKDSLMGRRASVRAALTRSRSELWQSTTNALPMPGTLGLEPTWKPEDADKKREEFTMGKGFITAEAWVQLLKWSDGGEGTNTLNRRLLRVYLLQQLIQAVLDAKRVSREDLVKVQDYIKILDTEDSAPRPIESHYLLMLTRDLPSPEPPRDVILQSLDVRIKAEKAALGNVMPDKDELVAAPGQPRHLYSEYVWRWIEEDIKAADRLRQDGENLLIGSKATYWKDAAPLFAVAEKKYRQARDNANIIREAVAARDRAMCELPYHGRWLAHHRPENVEEANRIDSQLKELVDLWKAVHELNALIELPPEKDETERAKQLATLQGKDRQVRDGFRVVKDRYDTMVSATKTQVNLQSVWQRIDDLLQTPLIPSSDRYNLVEGGRKVGTALNATFQGQPIQTVAPKPEVAVEESAVRAKREGDLAVALIGGLRLRKSADLPAFVSSGQWPRAGAECRKQWEALSDDAVKGSKACMETGDLTVAYDQVREGESAARLLDGAGSVRFDIKQQEGRSAGGALERPCQLARQLRLHDLLVWQVRRNGEEHWFEDNPSATPYYMTAGEGFYKDAEKLVKLNVEELDKLRLESPKMKTAAAAKAFAQMNVKVESTLPLDLTRAEIPWQLVPDPGVPSGQPMVWLKVGGMVQTADLFTERSLTNGTFGRQQYLTEVNIKDNNPQNSATLLGRYRGQILEKRYPLHNLAKNDLTVYRLPASPFGGLAIRADEAVKVGGISIVIDASGSMATKDAKTGKLRYDLALDALKQVLARMQRGVPVYLWCFGDGPDGFSAKQVFLGGGSGWSPEELYQAAVSMKEKNKLRGNSPIGRTMVKAFESLKDVEGFRAVLVLTDGEDNDLEDKVDAFLRETLDKDENKDVYMNMVLFQVGPKDDQETEKLKAKIKGQFKLVGERGGFTEADPEDLAAKLVALLVPRVVLLGGAQKQELDVTFANHQNLRWSGALDPESYNGRLYSSTLRPPVTVARGDRLFAALTTQGGRLELERVLFAQFEQKRRKKEVKLGDDRTGWLPGIVDHYYDGDNLRALRMLVTLEETKNVKGSGSLKQIHPGFRWIEVKPDSKNPMGTLRLWNDERFPAPTLGLSVDGWPRSETDLQPVGSTVEMWWGDEKTGSYPPVHATEKYTSLDGGRDVTVSGQRFSLGFSEEERLVRVSAAGEEKRKCLVLRFTPQGGSGKRIWARIKPEGASVRGEEHVYFRTPDGKEGAYTAYFWDLEKKDITSLELNLTSIETFKEQAKSSNRYQEFTLDRPSRSPSLEPVRLEKKGP